MHGLDCLRGEGGLEQLRRLNRPAIVRVYDSQGAPRWLVLERLQGRQVTLAAGGARTVVDIDKLAGYDIGEFVLLWRPPAHTRGTLAAGDRGAGVAWLVRRLGAAGGATSGAAADPLFDETVADAVRRFQRAAGIVDRRRRRPGDADPPRRGSRPRDPDAHGGALTMSYILDALKKSERQRPPGPVPDLFTVHGPQPPSPRWPTRAIVVAALLLWPCRRSPCGSGSAAGRRDEDAAQFPGCRARPRRAAAAPVDRGVAPRAAPRRHRRRAARSSARGADGDSRRAASRRGVEAPSAVAPRPAGRRAAAVPAPRPAPAAVPAAPVVAATVPGARPACSRRPPPTPGGRRRCPPSRQPLRHAAPAASAATLPAPRRRACRPRIAGR